MRPRLFLTILVTIILLIVASCAPATTVISLETNEASVIPSRQAQQRLDQRPLGQRPLTMRPSQGVEGRKRCADATPADERACARLERQILASTVRFKIIGPSNTDHNQISEGVGHGTVKDGRYLVVHNHFSVDLTVFADESYTGDASISMYDGFGDLFAWEVRPPLFTVTVVEPETLVLDFGTDSTGKGFFESWGLQSATFMNWQEESPRAGQEVAQVVWDYRYTTIEWVLIKEVITVDDIPRLNLSSQLLKGASGGGVFFNGNHIAVNWLTVRLLWEGSEVLEQFSTVALNSYRVVASPLWENS